MVALLGAGAVIGRGTLSSKSEAPRGEPLTVIEIVWIRNLFAPRGKATSTMAAERWTCQSPLHQTVL